MSAEQSFPDERTADSNSFQQLVENSPELCWIIDADRRITFVSPAVTKRLGWTPGTLIGARADILVPPEELDLYTAILRSLEGRADATSAIEMQVLRSDSSRAWVSGQIKNLSHLPSISGMVVTARDIDQRRRYEESLLEQGFFDSLTSLPTRTLFIDRLDQAIRLARNDLIVKVLYIDIDNFSAVNHQLGFGAADDLLRQAAARLVHALPKSAIIGRFINDEFLIADVSSESNRGELVSAVTQVFTEPFQVSDRSVRLSASTGLTTTTRSDMSAKELIDQAGSAAYEARRLGSGQAVTWSQPLNTRSVFRRETESQLRNAVDNNELRLHYQPVIDNSSRQAVGIEALVRWEHPSRGLIPPSEFITIAEETGMIVDIGYWVMDQTTALVAELNESWRGKPLYGAVNISSRQLNDSQLVRRAQMAILRSGILPSQLHLDISEGSLQGAETRIGRQLRRLSQIGIELAIDDFGTGAASLEMLRDTPASYLKIDRSFTSRIADGGSSLVTGIIAVAHALGLLPVAEGVETEQQLGVLSEMGCPFSQGYLHARPLPKAELISFLADNYLQLV